MQSSVVQVSVPTAVPSGTAMKSAWWCLSIVLLIVSQALANADEKTDPPASEDVLQFTPADLTFFETNVRPLLAENCYACHGDEKQKGGLRLDSREAILTGGESGAAIVAGNSGDSLLLQAVRYESFEMPPDKKLPDESIDLIATPVIVGVYRRCDHLHRLQRPPGTFFIAETTFSLFHRRRTCRRTCRRARPRSAATHPFVEHADRFIRQLLAGWHFKGFVTHGLQEQTVA